LCYARALSTLERLRVAPPAMAMAMAGAGGPLMRRIQRLVSAKTQECGPSKLPGILALCLGLACFAVNAHRARGQEQEAGVKTIALSYFRGGAGSDGPGVKVDLGGASMLHRTPVEYPGHAFEKKVQGIVVVEATLDSAGDVTD